MAINDNVYKIRTLSDSIARDTIRCVMIEYIYPSVIVHTITLCNDHHRDGTDTSFIELIYDMDSRSFVNKMIEVGLQVDEIYVDYFRMPAAYARTMLRPQFFHNLLKFSTSILLRRRQNEDPQIFIPFWPHCFILYY